MNPGLILCWRKTGAPLLVFPKANEESLRGQLGVAGRGEASAEVLEDVKGQTAHQRDDGHLPQKRHCGDEVHVWQGRRGQRSERGCGT